MRCVTYDNLSTLDGDDKVYLILTKDEAAHLVNCLRDHGDEAMKSETESSDAMLLRTADAIEAVLP